MTAFKRVTKELDKISTHEDYVVNVDDSDIYEWQVSFQGPAESYYRNKVIVLSIKFNQEYPFVAPSVKVTSKLIHPNISTEGKVCIELLNSWNPQYTISMVLSAIKQLLIEPNWENPSNPELVEIYYSDKERYEALVS